MKVMKIPNKLSVLCLKNTQIFELISNLKPDLAKIFPNPVLTSNRIIQGPERAQLGNQPCVDDGFQLDNPIHSGISYI